MRASLRGHEIDSKHVAQQSAGKNHHVLEIPLSFLTLLKLLSEKLLILLHFLDQKMVFVSELIILHQRLAHHSL
jgi:hypothetical protein